MKHWTLPVLGISVCLLQVVLSLVNGDRHTALWAGGCAFMWVTFALQRKQADDALDIARSANETTASSNANCSGLVQICDEWVGLYDRCNRQRKAGLEQVRKLTKENTRLLDALTWRPCPDVVTEPGVYLVRWHDGFQLAYEIADTGDLPEANVERFYIAGPLLLREGGE